MAFKAIPRQKPYCSWRDFFIFLKMFFKKELFNGPHIKSFEETFAQVYQIPYALATGSCRSAFALIIEALDIQAGDEVILPAYNLAAFPKILKFKKIKPVFVDIDPDTLNIDVKLIEEHITARTKAIVAVHLFGNPCDMHQLMAISRKYKIPVIEDCANAYRTMYDQKYVGLYGTVACFSLGNSKDISTMGGGMIITRDQKLYQQMRQNYEQVFTQPRLINMVIMFVRHLLLKVMTSRYVFLIFVYPVVLFFAMRKYDIIGAYIEEEDIMIKKISKKRYTNFQACIGLDKFKAGSRYQEQRQENARLLNAALSAIDEDIDVTQAVPKGFHAYWNFPVLCPKRDQLLMALVLHGIDAKKVYKYDCNQMNIFKEYQRECPSAKAVEKDILALPIYHLLSTQEIEYIRDSLVTIMTTHPPEEMQKPGEHKQEEASK